LKRLSGVLRFLLFLSIGAGLFWLAFRNLNLSKMVAQFKSAHYIYIFIALGVSLLSHFFRALRWNLLIKPLGYKVPARNSFIAVLIGYMVNFAIPRMGEVSRCVILNRSEKIPLNKLIGTVFIERLFDTLTLLIIIVITFIAEYQRLKDLIYDYIYTPFLNSSSGIDIKLIIIIGMIIIAMIIASILIIRFIRQKSADNKFMGKIHSLLTGFYAGIKTIKTMDRKWEFILYTILIWTGYWMMTYIVFFAFDLTASLGPIAGLAVLAIGSLGIVFPSPGGIGSFHFAAILALSFYQPAGVSDIDWKNTSGLYAIVNHESQMFFLIAAGAIAYMLFVIQQRKHHYKDVSLFVTDLEEEIDQNISAS
jgi:glycosyltransferase 2 family protein